MKKYIEAFKELKKKPYGKAVIFFGFYLIFFIFLAIMARTSPRRVINSGDYQKGKKRTASLVSLIKNNYSFSYKINLDEGNYIYTGNKKGKEYYFIYNSQEYKIIDNICYINENNNWKETSSPIKFNKFINPEELNEVLKSSSFEAKTTFDDGKEVYNYLLSTNTINYLFDKNNTDYDEIPNRITISLNTNGEIETISFDLNSYCKLNNLCSNNLKIEMSYEFE